MNTDEAVEHECALGCFVTKIINAKRINKICCTEHRLGWGLFDMTPSEEKHSKFFNAEAVYVKDLTDIELDAHIEELRDVILEAKARYSASDTERNSRKSKKQGIRGFERSVETDSVSSDAINAINNRAARMSKADKVRKSLKDLGLSEAEIDQMMSARNIRDTTAPVHVRETSSNKETSSGKETINEAEIELPQPDFLKGLFNN